jgi:CRISPR-associated protein Csx3
MNLLPAILIGGPPHSGKSVLAYSLSQALRARNLPHYLMRAAPDGEGDWSQEMPPALLDGIRFKGDWNDHWVHVVCRDLARRPVPFLVDVGGRPQGDQFRIFDQCTGAILLTPNQDSRREWHALAASHGLPILADLHSTLEGENKRHSDVDGRIMGVLAGLQRGFGQLARGPAFDAVVNSVATIFDYPAQHVRDTHLREAPPDALVVPFDALAAEWYPDDPQHHFPDTDADRILAAVPQEIPIAAYGRMPCWLATLLGARRNLAYQFDVRLGWVRTPQLKMLSADANGDAAHWREQLTFERVRLDESCTRLDVMRTRYYLDIEAIDGASVPFVPPGTQLTLNGGLPLWLFAALGRAYRHCASIWAAQPQRAS